VNLAMNAREQLCGLHTILPAGALDAVQRVELAGA
jgi:hypothetical protein